MKTEESMLNKKYLLLIIVFFLIIIILLFVNYQDKKTSNEFEQFNKTPIMGRIYYIKQYSRESIFQIKNDSRTYVFHPFTDQNLNDNHIFNYFAKPGDSIFKAAYADTLYLYKNGNIYCYTFRKF